MITTLSAANRIRGHVGDFWGENTMGRGPTIREPTTQLPVSALRKSDYDMIIDVGARHVFHRSNVFGTAAVADAFGISERHLRRLIDADAIPGHLYLTEITDGVTSKWLAVLPHTHSTSAQVVHGRLIEGRVERRRHIAEKNFGRVPS